MALINLGFHDHKEPERGKKGRNVCCRGLNLCCKQEKSRQLPIAIAQYEKIGYDVNPGSAIQYWASGVEDWGGYAWRYMESRMKHTVTIMAIKNRVKKGMVTRRFMADAF